MLARCTNVALPLVKEVKDITNLDTVVALLNTGEWIVISGTAAPKSASGYFFTMGRI